MSDSHRAVPQHQPVKLGNVQLPNAGRFDWVSSNYGARTPPQEMTWANVIISRNMSPSWSQSNVNIYWVLWQRTEEGNGTPLQYSCLENPMDGGAWWAAVHGIVKSRTRLSDFTFPFHFHALEKEMATHSSVLAWRIPETGEPGGLPSVGSHRVGHDWSDLAAAAAAAERDR